MFLVYSIDNDRSEIGWLQKSSMGSRGKNLTEEVGQVVKKECRGKIILMLG